MNVDLRQLKRDWNSCTLCPLHKTAHLHVFYRGACPCDVLLVGEAPGNDEDLYGEPFIGPAGKLLDEMIEDAIEELKIELPYEKTFGFTNIVACRPWDREAHSLKPPVQGEAKACNPRYVRTIEIAKPRLIVLVGGVAKKFHKLIPKPLQTIPTLAIQHTSYILRPPHNGKGSYAYEYNMLILSRALDSYHAEKESKTEKGAKRKFRKKTTLRKKTLPLRSKSKS